MGDQKCVVEGCSLEYDVVCSFSFYNANIGTEEERKRQEWIEGAMQEDSECLWRHVSLQLCGYHFEMDNQGLWIDSPMLPELLTLQETTSPVVRTAADEKAAEIVRSEHNYSVEPQNETPENVSRLNVRQLVDTLGYLSLKNLQRKQLWVVKVETDKAEASITQSEQVITKMADPRQIIEIIPQAVGEGEEVEQGAAPGEVLQIMEDSTISDNFIYEIAEEQEISMEDVKEIPSSSMKQEWTVNILPDESKPKYAYIKHCSTGKKKRHFTADMTLQPFNQISLQGDFENYYILPDVDPSVGVEVTTSGEPENYIVEEYEHLVLDQQRPRKRSKKEAAKRKRGPSGGRVKLVAAEWAGGDEFGETDEYDERKAARVRRKNKKYLGYDFVT